MRLHQARMRGHDADTKTVGATFGRRNASLVNVIAVPVRLAALIQHRRSGIADVVVICFTVVRFHTHVVWIDRTEMNSRRDL